jgi:hypothetical protein
MLQRLLVLLVVHQQQVQVLQFTHDQLTNFRGSLLSVSFGLIKRRINMAMSTNVQDNSTGTSVKVNTNGDLQTVTPQVNTRYGGTTGRPNDVGAVRMFCEVDAGQMTGVPYLDSPAVTDDGRMQVCVDTPLFFDNFTETVQNTAIWRHQFTTMTMTMGAGYLLCNANSTATTATGCQYSTWQTFPLFGSNGIHWEATGVITAVPLVGQVFEAGLFPYGANAQTAPTEGVYFRVTEVGLYGVMNYNGTETITPLIMAAASMPLNVNGQYRIVVTQREAEFWVNGILATAPLPCATGQGEPFMTSALPISFQQRNGAGLTGTQMQVKIASTHFDQNGFYNKTNAELMAGMGYMGSQGQDGGTVGSTAILSNAATAVAAALVNTTASAQFTGLGGAFLVLPTLTSGTDGILCDYAIPVGGVNQTPRRLVIRGVWIDAGVQTALTGGPLNLVYSLAYGHTSVSLAQTETASFATGTTKAPRRIPLGRHDLIAAAAAGIPASVVKVQFLAPIYVNPGERVAIACRNMGTVTTAGALSITVGFDANWE